MVTSFTAGLSSSELKSTKRLVSFSTSNDGSTSFFLDKSISSSLLPKALALTSSTLTLSLAKLLVNLTSLFGTTSSLR